MMAPKYNRYVLLQGALEFALGIFDKPIDKVEVDGERIRVTAGSDYVRLSYTLSGQEDDEGKPILGSGTLRFLLRPEDAFASPNSLMRPVDAIEAPASGDGAPSDAHSLRRQPPTEEVGPRELQGCRARDESLRRRRVLQDEDRLGRAETSDAQLDIPKFLRRDPEA